MLRMHQDEEGVLAPALVSVASATIAAVMAACYVVARHGFATDRAALARAVGLALLLLSLPVLTRRFLLRHSPDRAWFTATGFLALSCVAVAALAGATVGQFSFICWLPLPMGAAATVASLWTCIRRAPLLTVLLICGASFVALWWASLAWGYGYASPLYLESIAAHSASPTAVDTIFHVAIANMIKGHGVASTGLDGVVPLRYHVGSHWMIVQLASLLRISVFDFYQFGVAIVLYPLLSAMVPWFALALPRGATHADTAKQAISSRFWLLWAAGIIGVLPLNAMTDLAIGWWRPISESYTASLILAFGTLSGLVALLRRPTWREVRFSDWEQAVFLCAVLPVLVCVCGVTKSSTMVLFGVAGGYSLLRLRLYRNPVWALSAALTFLGCAAVLWLIRMPEFSTPFPLHFLIAHVNYSWFALWPAGYLIWVWIFVGFRLRGQASTPLRELRHLFAGGAFFDVELLLVVAIVGLIPGLLLAIPGQSAGYFSDPQRWLALAMLMALVRARASAHPSLRLPELQLKRMGALLIALLTAGVVVVNVGVMLRRFVKENRAIRAAFQAALKKLPAPAASNDQLPEYALLKHLRDVDSLGARDKSETAVFIPRENQLFWSLLPECQVPFLVPALAGVPLVGGLPASRCPYFAYWTYAARPGGWSPGVTATARACERGHSLGFDHVAWLAQAEVQRDACAR